LSTINQDKFLTEKFLAGVPLFQNLSKEHLKHIVRDFKIVRVNKFENVVIKSDEGTDLYIVLKGNVKVSLLSREGNEFRLTTFNQGDFFGEMSLIDGQSRSATITAEEETSLGILKREKFLNNIRRDPIIAYNMLIALVQRLRKANDLIEALLFLDISERVIKFLVLEAKNNNKKDKSGFYKVKKITHKELASRIGASREAVSKVLKVLNLKESIIDKNNFFLISPDIYSEKK
jgi:CRP-like cAMP-binding protein